MTPDKFLNAAMLFGASLMVLLAIILTSKYLAFIAAAYIAFTYATWMKE